jgi:hypothetical protein
LEGAVRNPFQISSSRPNFFYFKTNPGVNETSMSHSPHSIHSRRQFLFRSSALSLAGLFPLRLNAQGTGYKELEKSNPQLDVIPKDSLLKFNPDGSPRRFAGNTVICHLQQQSRFHDAVAALGDALRSSSFAAELAVLPSDSYHATILGGPNDQDRSRYGWPSDIPINTPIAECNRIIGERIARFRPHTELPLRFCLDKEKTLAPQRPSGLQIVPADANEGLKIRTLRDRMADEVFRYRAADHDTFGFHISLAYQMRGLAAVKRREYQIILMQHLSAIVAAAPVIEFGVPEFCTFENMYRFELQTLLRT